MSAFSDLCSGLLGGCSCVIVGHPLDSVKVIMQTQNVSGCTQVIRDIVFRHGYSGLYAGLFPALAANMAENGVLFLSYGKVLQLLDAHVLNSPTVDSNNATGKDSFTRGALAGSVSAVITSTVLCPIELFKCRKQVHVTESSFNIGMEIFKKSGFSGFFRGMVPTLCREVPGNFAFFGTYQGLSGYFKTSMPEHETLGTLLAGGLGGMAFWLVAQPADTIKSNMQVMKQDTTALKSVLSYCRTYGVLGLYRGIVPVLLRAFPSNAALFLTVEKVKDVLEPKSIDDTKKVKCILDTKHSLDLEKGNMLSKVKTCSQGLKSYSQVSCTYPFKTASTESSEESHLLANRTLFYLHV